MASKRFSIANMEARGSVRKQARLDGNSALVAVIRPWGSAFWVFEGGGCVAQVISDERFDFFEQFNLHQCL